MKRLVLVPSLALLLLATCASVGAADEKPVGGPLKSCMAELMIPIQVSDPWLRQNVGTDSKASNLNEVMVDVYASYVQADKVMCQYQSEHRDIPNLVYEFTCPGAVLADNGYAHAYRCTD